MIMSYFAVPRQYQFRVLFWGIFGALVLRFIFIFAGVGAARPVRVDAVRVRRRSCIVTAVRLLRHDDEEIHPEHNPVLKAGAARRAVDERVRRPVDVRRRSTGAGWPRRCFAVLVVIETSDVIFAVDSIPAILAVSREHVHRVQLERLRHPRPAGARTSCSPTCATSSDYLQHGPGRHPRLRRRQDDHLGVVPHPHADLAGRDRRRPRGRILLSIRKDRREAIAAGIGPGRDRADRPCDSR